MRTLPHQLPAESRNPWLHPRQIEIPVPPGAIAPGPSPPPRRPRPATSRCAGSAACSPPTAGRWPWSPRSSWRPRSSAWPRRSCCARSSTTRCPSRTSSCWSGWSLGMVAVAAVTSALRRHPDLDQHQGRPAGHAPAAHRRVRAPAAAVDRLLHPDPHRRGAVPHHQRHRRHGSGGHLDRDLHRLQPDHRGRHRGRDGRAVLAAVADLAGRHAAGDLPDPQGRPHAPGHHHRSGSANWPT